MMIKRNVHRKKQNFIQRKSKILISAEGSETELIYFNLLNKLGGPIKFVTINGKFKCSTDKVLSRMKNYINENKLRSGDEAWLIVDRDSWKIEQLKELESWAKSESQNFAISIPCFETWLLMHYGVTKKFDTAQRCKKYFESNYCSPNGQMKLANLTADKFESLVKEAIKVAENFDPRNNINEKFNFIELDQVN